MKKCSVIMLVGFFLLFAGTDFFAARVQAETVDGKQVVTLGLLIPATNIGAIFGNSMLNGAK